MKAALIQDIKWPTSLKGTAAERIIIESLNQHMLHTVGRIRELQWVQNGFKCMQALMWQMRETVLMALLQFKHLTKLTEHD